MSNTLETLKNLGVKKLSVKDNEATAVNPHGEFPPNPPVGMYGNRFPNRKPYLKQKRLQKKVQEFIALLPPLPTSGIPDGPVGIEDVEEIYQYRSGKIDWTDSDELPEVTKGINPAVLRVTTFESRTALRLMPKAERLKEQGEETLTDTFKKLSEVFTKEGFDNADYLLGPDEEQGEEKPERITKPPIGLLAKWRHDELRVREISLAIERYEAVSKAIPKEWIDELNQLTNTSSAPVEPQPEKKEADGTQNVVNFLREKRESGILWKPEKKEEVKPEGESLKVQVWVSDIKQIKKRLAEINDNDIKDVVFLDDNGTPIKIEQTIIDDWKFTGLNISDFIDTDFYKTGFTTNPKK